MHIKRLMDKKLISMDLLRKKVVLWLCLVCFVCILIVYQFSNEERNSPSKRGVHDHDKRYNRRDSLACNESVKSKWDNRESNTDDNIIYNRLNEVISEEEALRYEPCQDPKLVANSKLSTLTISGSPNVYAIGDKIYAHATLFDSYGRQKTSGGDYLRARISNADLKAFAPGVVYDHRNGSYTIIFEALWSGKSYISATIAYTREAITAQYRLISALVSIRLIMAKYEGQKYQEDVLCHPDNNHLLTHTTYKAVCNFTSLNSGMSWYCGKPLNPELKCSDWTSVKPSLPTKWPKTITKCEKEILSSKLHQVLTKTIAVVVKECKQNFGKKIINHYEPSVSCSKYNTTELWYAKHTTGYFFNGKWKLRHCEGKNVNWECACPTGRFHRANFQSCLRNKRLYLTGDSTTRQWYVDMLKRYNCTQYTEQWTHANWAEPSGCTVAFNNFTVTWEPHRQPFFAGTDWHDPKNTFMSISKRLELILTDEDAIVLIHMFSHMIPFHHTSYRNRMKEIRVSVKKLLKRNNKVKIFIKMPHAYTSSYAGGSVNDFPGYIFSHIIIETFKGLYDKIFILDNKDATVALASVTLHPLPYVVESMVDQMFSYICH